MIADDAQPFSGGDKLLEGPEGPGAAAWKLGWRGWLLIFGFWTLFGVAWSATLFLSPIRQEAAAEWEIVAFTFLGAYVWAALTLPLFRLTGRFDLLGERRLSALALIGLIGVALAITVSTTVAAVSYLVFQQLLTESLVVDRGIGSIARYRLLPDLLACLLVLSAGVAGEYFLRYQARREEGIVLRAQLVEARLEVLRTQLNPHFLFNTLNAVAALVAKDPRGVRQMLARLSELLRHTLEGRDEPEIALEKELDLLRRYLELMEIRFQGRLEVELDADPDALGALVPNLILQPLAENAVKHGAGLAPSGRVEVEARREGETLVLSVRDTGSGGSQEGRAAWSDGGGEGGFGLAHTRERLERLYGEDASLELIPGVGGGMTAEIRLPYRLRPALSDGTVVEERAHA